MSETIFSKCGMRCDLCLIYRPNVEKDDRRAEICPVFEQMAPGFHADPKAIICDGCQCANPNAMLLDPSCKARQCVMDKALPHCGWCGQYPCSIFPAEPTQEELVQLIDIEKRWTWQQEEELLQAYHCKKNMDAFRRNRESRERNDSSTAF